MTLTSTPTRYAMLMSVTPSDGGKGSPGGRPNNSSIPLARDSDPHKVFLRLEK